MSVYKHSWFAAWLVASLAVSAQASDPVSLAPPPDAPSPMLPAPPGAASGVPQPPQGIPQPPAVPLTAALPAPPANPLPAPAPQMTPQVTLPAVAATSSVPTAAPQPMAPLPSTVPALPPPAAPAAPPVVSIPQSALTAPTPAAAVLQPEAPVAHQPPSAAPMQLPPAVAPMPAQVAMPAHASAEVGPAKTDDKLLRLMIETQDERYRLAQEKARADARAALQSVNGAGGVGGAAITVVEEVQGNKALVRFPDGHRSWKTVGDEVPGFGKIKQVSAGEGIHVGEGSSYTIIGFAPVIQNQR